MSYLEIAELISVILTTPTIILSAVVVFLWGPKSIQIFKRGPQDAAEWFIIGVAIGFLGETLDNMYWNIPWSLDFIRHSKADDFFEHGVIANIPFRQILGSVAAFCHIKSYTMHEQESDIQDTFLKRVTSFSIVLAILYAWCLILIRG